MVRLNADIPKNVQLPKRFLTLSLLVLLVLPVFLLVSSSLVSATLLRKVYGHAARGYALPAPGGQKAENELAQGKFLVADRQLTDPNFREAVVLLLRYGPDGAMGLVINRPLPIKLSTVFPDIKELDRSDETLFLGGPVEPGGILLLVKSESEPEDSTPVFGDVYLGTSQSVLQRLIKKPDKNDRFRIFAGYAGWAAQQLEFECESGGWHVLEADDETLFDRKSSEIWPELIQRVSANWVNLKAPARSEIPEISRQSNRTGIRNLWSR